MVTAVLEWWRALDVRVERVFLVHVIHDLGVFALVALDAGRAGWMKMVVVLIVVVGAFRFDRAVPAAVGEDFLA